jgi:hypothetical protein
VAQGRLHQPVDRTGEVIDSGQDVTFDQRINGALGGKRPVPRDCLEIPGHRRDQRAQVGAQVAERALLFGLALPQLLDFLTQSLVLFAKIVVRPRCSRNDE